VPVRTDVSNDGVRFGQAWNQGCAKNGLSLGILAHRARRPVGRASDSHWSEYAAFPCELGAPIYATSYPRTILFHVFISISGLNLMVLDGFLDFGARKPGDRRLSRLSNIAHF
jgi:hypothetical protein